MIQSTTIETAEASAGTRRLDPARWLGRRGIFLVVLLGPVLAVATSVVMGSRESGGGSPELLRAVLLADLCYILVLTALITWQIGRLIAARRRRSMGSQLHLRLTGVFALMALVPAVIVAIFATLTVNFGIEGWFSDRVGSVVRNSLETARAYEREHRRTIRGEILAMANDLNRAAAQGIDGSQLNALVAQQALLRALPEAFVFNTRKEILARGEFSYLFSFEAPTEDQLTRARGGEVVIMEDEVNNEIRALVYLTNFFDAFLYVSRDVQGDVLRLLDETQETVQLYEQLERDRDSILFDFALIYLGFALLVIVAATLLGLWFAERLSKPVGRLATAAARVGDGDLDVRVKEERGSDEFSVLGRVFNRMTEQLGRQRDALVQAREDSERRRHFIEAVLSGVRAGVIGLDATNRVDLVNDAAAGMLGFDRDAAHGQPLVDVAPAFAPMVESAQRTLAGVAQGEVRMTIGGETREFLARCAPRSDTDPCEGRVLTFDDVTALATAQRMAAWGDVARRIAHEIKNPLTPIQLSADRMRRKFAPRLAEDGPAFEHYLDVITRQAGDIRRMVDSFSKFAKMPEPVLAEQNLAALVRDALVLQRESRPDIAWEAELGEDPAPCACDRGMIAQCIGNLLLNAADAVDQRHEADPAAPPGRIRAVLSTERGFWRIAIEDNGIGLPDQGRERLVEPYVTTRPKGTGLGLAIVTKIAEQHGGEIALADAGGADGYDGARVVLRLPRQAAPAQTLRQA